MEYRKKLIVLLSLIAALALIYTASLVFDPERAGSRSASYTWLDSRLAGRIAGVTISGGNEKIEIVKRNREWFVSHNGREYPARQLRVEDFISIFSTRAPYPVRSTGASSLVRLGLGEDAASRITIYGENTVLLDLLLGAEDSSGREIYLCKYGQNEVRSGDDKFSSYMAGSVNSWYNLRLIPETEDGKIGADSVQRLS
ncbi:MAG: DUF4340 domain-containing protein, partial [Treponema sp.]|nr:DUF4340 domain-containing protein [Treponema sp.]